MGWCLMQPLDDLQLSVSNLWSEFGSTDNILAGLAINLSLALVGVLVWYTTTGWLSFAGAVWAILNVLGIVSWVMQA